MIWKTRDEWDGKMCWFGKAAKVLQVEMAYDDGKQLEK